MVSYVLTYYTLRSLNIYPRQFKFKTADNLLLEYVELKFVTKSDYLYFDWNHSL